MINHVGRKLFSPVHVGTLALSHRAVMAPLTRSRSEQPGDIPGKLMLEYYTQRASEGGLIIFEATTISITSRGWLAHLGCTQTSRSSAGRKSRVLFMPRVAGCSRSFGTRVARRYDRWYNARGTFRRSVLLA